MEETTTLTCDQLKVQVENAKTRSEYLNGVYNTLRDKVQSVKDYLMENYEDMGEDHAKEIAELLGLELTKTVKYEVNVTFEIETEVPFDYDSDDFEGDLSFSVDHGEFDLDVSDSVVYCKERSW